jgi:hypothetical protein
MSLADGAAAAGLTAAQIIKAAEWVAKPKDDGSRHKCVTAYEIGIIWGNDLYRAIGRKPIWGGIREISDATPAPYRAASHLGTLQETCLCHPAGARSHRCPRRRDCNAADRRWPAAGRNREVRHRTPQLAEMRHGPCRAA